jgi:hypothetical protein
MRRTVTANVFDAPETQPYELFEMRCRAPVQQVNGYQPSVDSNLAANGLRVIGRRFNVFST